MDDFCECRGRKSKSRSNQTNLILSDRSNCIDNCVINQPIADTPIQAECCNCGNCCLINQQFTLTEQFNFNQVTAVTVYEASGVVPACVPGQSGEGVDIQSSGLSFPFGTLIVTNIGANTFNVTVESNDSEANPITRDIAPGAQIAFSGVFRRVTALLPSDPIRSRFRFNLFSTPGDPI